MINYLIINNDNVVLCYSVFCCAILVNCVVADGSLIIVSAVLCKFQLTVQSSRLKRRHEPVKRAVFIAKKTHFTIYLFRRSGPLLCHCLFTALISYSLQFFVFFYD